MLLAFFLSFPAFMAKAPTQLHTAHGLQHDRARFGLELGSWGALVVRAQLQLPIMTVSLKHHQQKQPERCTLQMFWWLAMALSLSLPAHMRSFNLRSKRVLREEMGFSGPLSGSPSRIWFRPKARLLFFFLFLSISVDLYLPLVRTVRRS